MTIFNPAMSKEANFYSSVYAISYGLRAPLLLLACVLRIEWMGVLMKSLGLVHTSGNRTLISAVRLFGRVLKNLSALAVGLLAFLEIAYLATKVDGTQLPYVLSSFSRGVTIVAASLLILLIATHQASLLGVYTEVDLNLTTQTDSKTNANLNSNRNNDNNKVGNETDDNDTLSTTSIIIEKLKRQISKSKGDSLEREYEGLSKEGYGQQKKQSTSATQAIEEAAGLANGSELSIPKAGSLNRVVTDYYFAGTAVVLCILLIAYSFQITITNNPVTTFVFSSIMINMLELLMCYLVLSKFSVEHKKIKRIVYAALGNVECNLTGDHGNAIGNSSLGGEATNALHGGQDGGKSISSLSMSGQSGQLGSQLGSAPQYSGINRSELKENNATESPLATQPQNLRDKKNEDSKEIDDSNYDAASEMSHRRSKPFPGKRVASRRVVYHSGEGGSGNSNGPASVQSDKGFPIVDIRDYSTFGAVPAHS
jgi:hypothetical protein